jgi:hypothetical protein
MALVKNPKAALARSRAARSRSPTSKNVVVPVEGARKPASATAGVRSVRNPDGGANAKASPLDHLAPRGASKKRATIALRTDGVRVGRGAASPHGLIGDIPLGHRSPPYDESVEVLKASEDFCGACDAERLVARILIEEFRQRHKKRDDGDEWFAWIGNVAYQQAGLTFWIGLSSNIPVGAFDVLAATIMAMGFSTERAAAIPDKHGLEPLLYLGNDGLELLRMI